MLAHERSWLAATEVTKAIVICLNRQQLMVATEEVGWLGVPMSSIDGNAAGQAESVGAISIYPVIRKNAQESTPSNGDNAENAATSDTESKNKDGNGNKRKNRRAADDPLKSGDVRMNATSKTHFQTIEEFVAHEEIFLNGVFNVLSQVC